MNGGGFDPATITRPIQLSAAWFATLLVLDGTLLGAASQIAHPTWAAGVLVAAAVALPVLVGAVVFALQTRYRAEQMADPLYSEWRRRQEEAFRGFKPEAVSIPMAVSPDPPRTPLPAPPPSARPEAMGSSAEETEDEFEADDDAEAAAQRAKDGYRLSYLLSREEIYELHQRLFLVHQWRPSTIRGQEADIIVELYLHPGGDIPEGIIERVEYDMGEHWPTRPMVRTNAADRFRLEISAFGTALCIAKVYFTDTRRLPLLLYRYLDFGLTVA